MSESDPFASLRAMDDDAVAEARSRNDDWGAMVRVCHDIANGEQPAPEDCEQVGLPYNSNESFQRVAVPGEFMSKPSPCGPTRRQVRPLARSVVDRLRNQKK